MIPERGYQSRRSDGQGRLGYGGSDGDPPEPGSPPGRLPGRKMTREECAAFWTRALRSGRSPGDVLKILHRTGAPPERIAAGLRACGWPDGRTTWAP